MLIKYPQLSAILKKQRYALYMISGQDPYLMNDAHHQIKKAHLSLGDVDTKSLQIASPGDWSLLSQEANSYSLFAENILIQVNYDKKSIDKTGKAALQNYLQNGNERCAIIFIAPNLPAKQLSWLSNEKTALVIQAYPFSASALHGWIKSQLLAYGLQSDPELPALIQQYTQGNMLACAQAIEKMALVHAKDKHLSLEQAREQLTDQCDYQLYELADACLNAQLEKAIRLLRRANEQRTEPTLILWIITQEIRQLIQLHHLTQQSMTFSAACNQLKIWSMKSNQYQAAFKRLPLDYLYNLLQMCNQLDQQIKCNPSHPVWHDFENLALALCSNLETIKLNKTVGA